MRPRGGVPGATQKRNPGLGSCFDCERKSREPVPDRTRLLLRGRVEGPVECQNPVRALVELSPIWALRVNTLCAVASVPRATDRIEGGINVRIIRSSEIPSQENMGMRLFSIASPDTGASDVVVLRGVVTAGGTFPAHSHDREEILYFLTGAGTYTVGEDTGSISAGDVIIIPAGALHAFDATEDLDAIAVLPSGAKTFAPDGTEMNR